MNVFQFKKISPPVLLFGIVMLTIVSGCTKDEGIICVQEVWYEDSDGDGLGNQEESVNACEEPDGYVSNSNDTDDSVSCLQAWYEDADNDGLGNPEVMEEACEQPSGFVANGDDLDDGTSCLQTWYEDADDDGLGNPDSYLETCEQPEGYVLNGDDTDDTTSCIKIWYEDSDEDGLGNPGVTLEACEQPEGYVLNSDDNDDNAAPSKTLAEIINEDMELADIAAYIGQDSELQSILDGSDEYTVFVPSNDALQAYLAELNYDDLSVLRDDLISNILHFHFHLGAIGASQMDVTTTLETLQGESILFSEDNNITTGGSNMNVAISQANLWATNGVVHIVDAVLIPPTLHEEMSPHIGKVSQEVLFAHYYSDLAEIIALADADVPQGESAIKNVLSGTTALTFFAPDNTSIEMAAGMMGMSKENLIQNIIAPNSLSARNFLIRHIAEGLFDLNALQGLQNSGAKVTMMSGDQLAVIPMDIAVTPMQIALLEPVSGVVSPIFDTNVFIVSGSSTGGALNGLLNIMGPMIIQE